MSSECIICLDSLLYDQAIYTCTKCNVIVHKKCKEDWYRARTDVELNIYICPHCQHSSIIPSLFTNDNTEDIPYIPYSEDISRRTSFTDHEQDQYRQMITIANCLKCVFLFVCLCTSCSTIIIGIYFFSNQFLITYNYTITA